MAEQFFAQRFAGLISLFKRNKRFDHFTDHRIGLADDAGLGHGRMLHQRALDFERADQMARGFNHIVGAADEPEVTVGILLGEIAGQIPTAGEAFAVAFFLVQIGAKHRWPTRSQRQLADLVGFHLYDRAVFALLDNRRFDARQRLAHRAGANLHGVVVGDHDAAGLGLPPVVVDRQAKRFLPPHHRFGIERLADAGDKTQRRKIVLANSFRSRFHHHAHRRRRGVPDGNFLLLNNAIPALGVEVRFVDDAGDAVRQRRDNPVGSPGDPTRIGGAPENIAGMKIEGVLAGDVMRDHRLVHMHGALRLARRAGGEVNQRHVFGIGWDRSELLAGCMHHFMKALRVGRRGHVSAADHQNMLERRQRAAQFADLAPLVKRLRRHQHVPFADG